MKRCECGKMMVLTLKGFYTCRCGVIFIPHKAGSVIPREQFCKACGQKTFHPLCVKCDPQNKFVERI